MKNKNNTMNYIKVLAVPIAALLIIGLAYAAQTSAAQAANVIKNSTLPSNSTAVAVLKTCQTSMTNVSSGRSLPCDGWSIMVEGPRVVPPPYAGRGSSNGNCSTEMFLPCNKTTSSNTVNCDTEMFLPCNKTTSSNTVNCDTEMFLPCNQTASGNSVILYIYRSRPFWVYGPQPLPLPSGKYGVQGVAPSSAAAGCPLGAPCAVNVNGTVQTSTQASWWNWWYPQPNYVKVIVAQPNQTYTVCTGNQSVGYFEPSNTLASVDDCLVINVGSIGAFNGTYQPGPITPYNGNAIPQSGGAGPAIIPRGWHGYSWAQLQLTGYSYLEQP